MKMHQVVASVLCMALLLTLCLSVACSARTEQDKPSCSVLHRKGGAIP